MSNSYYFFADSRQNSYKLDYLSFGDQCFICYKINKHQTDIYNLGLKYNTVGSFLNRNFDKSVFFKMKMINAYKIETFRIK